MVGLIGIFGASLLFSCTLTPLVRLVARKCGLVDHPDARRKMHAAPIPLAGGVAVLASASLVLAVVLLLDNPLQEQLAGWESLLPGLFLAALLLCVLGVLDDCRCLRGRHKLAGQIVAVGIVIACDVQVHSIHVFSWEVRLGMLAIPFTAFWLLGAINSLNLIDGMDGLLGSVGTIISLAMGVMAVIGGHWAAACVAVALAGALVGFLRYNFPPATIFLGDAGSMVIGLVVGVLGIQSSLKAPATIALIAPLAVLTIPIFDTAAAIVRRKLTGKSIYTTDRGHLHHCLLQRGFSPRVALGLISSFCLLTVLGALASLFLQNELMAVVSVVVVIAVLVVTRLFGFAELLLVGQRLKQFVRGFLPARGARQIEMRIQGTTSWEGLLNMVTAPALQLNLQTVTLDVNAPALHEAYHARWDRAEKLSDDACLWHADLPLAVHGHSVGRLKVVGRPDSESIAAKIATLLNVMKEFEVGLSADIAVKALVPAGSQKTEPVSHLDSNPVPMVFNFKVDLAGQTADQ